MEMTQPKPFIFVVMPFAKEFDDLYQLGVKACCTEAGAYCERVDEGNFEEGILSRIYNQISKADIIVAEMTGRNPNVFYEVGYAHALGKRVILLTSKAEDIPFDLIQYSHIVHAMRIVDLKIALRKRIDWCIEHPTGSLAQADLQVRLYCAGQELIPGAVIETRWTHYHLGYGTAKFVPLDLAIHNPTHRPYLAGSLQLGVVSEAWLHTCYPTPAEEGDHVVMPAESGSKAVKLPEGTMLHLLTWFSEKIFPSGWVSCRCCLEFDEYPDQGNLYCFGVRLFTEFGVRDFPFQVRFC